MRPGSWEDQKKKLDKSPDFHLDPEKMRDSFDDLIDNVGPAGAAADIRNRLEENPDDTEARRQANLLINKYAPFAEDLRALRDKLQH